MVVGAVPALGNFEFFIFPISKLGLVPTNIAYETDTNCGQNPPNTFLRVAFPEVIFNLGVRGL